MNIDANKVINLLTQDVGEYVKSLAIMRIQLEELQMENDRLNEELKKEGD